MRRLGNGVMRFFLLLCALVFAIGVARGIAKADDKKPASAKSQTKEATPRVKVLQWGCRWYEQEGRPRCSEQVGILGDSDEEHYRVVYVNSNGKWSKPTTALKDDIQTNGCPGLSWMHKDAYLPPEYSGRSTPPAAERVRPKQ